MTTISNRKTSNQATGIPWFIRPWTLFAANAACFAVNWWATSVETNRRDQFVNTCGKIIGMTGPVTVAVIIIFAILALSLILMITWCVKKRKSGGRWRGIIGTAISLSLFMFINLVLAGGDVTYMSFSFHCSSPG